MGPLNGEARFNVEALIILKSYQKFVWMNLLLTLLSGQYRRQTDHRERQLTVENQSSSDFNCSRCTRYGVLI